MQLLQFLVPSVVIMVAWQSRWLLLSAYTRTHKPGLHEGNNRKFYSL